MANARGSQGEGSHRARRFGEQAYETPTKLSIACPAHLTPKVKPQPLLFFTGVPAEKLFPIVLVPLALQSVVFESWISGKTPTEVTEGGKKLSGLTITSAL